MVAGQSGIVRMDNAGTREPDFVITRFDAQRQRVRIVELLMSGKSAAQVGERAAKKLTFGDNIASSGPRYAVTLSPDTQQMSAAHPFPKPLLVNICWAVFADGQSARARRSAVVDARCRPSFGDAQMRLWWRGLQRGRVM